MITPQELLVAYADVLLECAETLQETAANIKRLAEMKTQDEHDEAQPN